MLWYSVNILRGECDMTTWSSVTGMPSQSESLSAFSCRRVLPALVTKMVGTLHLLSARSHSREKASGAVGRTVLPRTITPSMSNMIPKLGKFVCEVARLTEAVARLFPGAASSLWRDSFSAAGGGFVLTASVFLAREAMASLQLLLGS